MYYYVWNQCRKESDPKCNDAKNRLKRGSDSFRQWFQKWNGLGLESRLWTTFNVLGPISTRTVRGHVRAGQPMSVNKLKSIKLFAYRKKCKVIWKIILEMHGNKKQWLILYQIELIRFLERLNIPFWTTKHFSFIFDSVFTIGWFQTCFIRVYYNTVYSSATSFEICFWNFSKIPCQRKLIFRVNFLF